MEESEKKVLYANLSVWVVALVSLIIIMTFLSDVINSANLFKVVIVFLSMTSLVLVVLSLMFNVFNVSGWKNPYHELKMQYEKEALNNAQTSQNVRTIEQQYVIFNQSLATLSAQNDMLKERMGEDDKKREQIVENISDFQQTINKLTKKTDKQFEGLPENHRYHQILLVGIQNSSATDGHKNYLSSFLSGAFFSALGADKVKITFATQTLHDYHQYVSTPVLMYLSNQIDPKYSRAKLMLQKAVEKHDYPTQSESG